MTRPLIRVETNAKIHAVRSPSCARVRASLARGSASRALRDIWIKEIEGMISASESCRALRTVQAGKPMTVKEIGAGAETCPALPMPMSSGPSVEEGDLAYVGRQISSKLRSIFLREKHT